MVRLTSNAQKPSEWFPRQPLPVDPALRWKSAGLLD